MLSHRILSRLLISALSASLLLLSANAFATTLVALYDKKHHRIVLAVDGLVGKYYAQAAVQECKLVINPGCAFAMAGFLGKSDPHFSLQEFADQACELPGILKNKADGFVKAAQEPVTMIAQYLQENEAQFYTDTFVKNGGEFAFVVFAGTENGNPIAYARGFKVQGDGSIKAVTNDIDGKTASGFFAGYNQQIAAYLKTHKNWSRMDTVTAARKFIELEIAAHPGGVGPPISILTVNRAGKQKWIDPGVCAAVPNTKLTKQTPTPPVP